MNNEKSVIESEETEIEDEAAKDTAVTPIVYNITSYGADYDVRGLVERINKSDISVSVRLCIAVFDRQDSAGCA